MIAIGSLKGDYYMLDEDNYQVIGRRTGKCYKLGSPVNVRVKGVDMLKRQIDFELVDDAADNFSHNESGSKKSHKKSSPKQAKKKNRSAKKKR